MSIRATALVWERSRAKGSNLLMLLAIADYAKDDGRWAWPSPRALSRKTRLSRRGGEMVLQALATDREVEPEWDGAHHRLYLHVRCVSDWDSYQTEGDRVVVSREATAGRPSAKFALKIRSQFETGRAQNSTLRAQNSATTLLSGSVSDPSGTVRSSVDVSPTSTERERFESFWEGYPKKVGKGAAWRAWTKVHPTEALTMTMLQALHAQAGFLARDGGTYTPNPATWLNDRRWEDEPPVVATPRAYREPWVCAHVPPCGNSTTCAIVRARKPQQVPA